eukprot:CAMPEP_0119134804 /NCGR_PEP_ID=MMETSP1310-20130426/17888_1 /TAXON_ID=464262 /ORGANISM="Genus nov. species nov., Strain RCC2339" /LENGTH=313 /DNA_ID=CAMNT_0007125637 /DNA_START=59 /DNA_END=1000 /DNA_ORIENTATION=-
MDRDLTPELEDWIENQSIFFVGTSPLTGKHINVSPKGLAGSLKRLKGNDRDVVLAHLPKSSSDKSGDKKEGEEEGVWNKELATFVYLDTGGSGVETVAHLRENGRITLMLCAFEGDPYILRLYGTGFHVEPSDPAFSHLTSLFESCAKASTIFTGKDNVSHAHKVRNYVVIRVYRIRKSCGYGVPLLELKGHRDTMPNYLMERSDETHKSKRMKKNDYSLDGLPGLRWVVPDKDKAGDEGGSGGSGGNKQDRGREEKDSGSCRYGTGVAVAAGGLLAYAAFGNPLGKDWPKLGLEVGAILAAGGLVALAGVGR